MVVELENLASLNKLKQNIMRLKTKIVLWILTILAIIGLAGIIWLVREAMAAEVAEIVGYYF